MNSANKYVILLNGHGSYDCQKILKIDFCDYEIVLPIGLDVPVSNAHHNLMMGCFTINITEAFKMLTLLPTTTITHQRFQLNNPIDLSEKECHYIHEHYLEEATNVIKVFNLVDLDSN